MIRPLLAKALRDGRLLLASLIVTMFCITAVHIWTTSRISLPAFSDFLMNAMPRQWERASGVPFSEVATPAGRVALTYVHPIILLAAIVWGIARGSDCVSGEIGRGTMEMLLAQPVSRAAVYGTQAVATVLGAVLLGLTAWCGTIVGLAISEQSSTVSATQFIPAAISLFGLAVCMAGMSALASSWDSQRWRTVGLMGGWYVVAMLLKILGRVSDDWQWAGYFSFLTPFEPQLLVAHPQEAWSLLAYHDGAVTGLGLGGQQLLLIILGVLCYLAGAVVFNRRELPAPL